jgi:hypothetical protein
LRERNTNAIVKVIETMATLFNIKPYIVVSARDVCSPKSLKYLALSAAADIAAFSPATLQDQPSAFALDLAFVGGCRLRDFGNATVVRDCNMDAMRQVLKLPPHLFVYEPLAGAESHLTATDKTLAFVKRNKKILSEVIDRAVEQLPSDHVISRDAYLYSHCRSLRCFHH